MTLSFSIALQVKVARDDEANGRARAAIISAATISAMMMEPNMPSVTIAASKPKRSRSRSVRTLSTSSVSVPTLSSNEKKKSAVRAKPQAVEDLERRATCAQDRPCGCKACRPGPT